MSDPTLNGSESIPTEDTTEAPAPERRFNVTLSFSNVDAVTAEKLKQILTDSVPLGTSFSISFYPTGG